MREKAIRAISVIRIRLVENNGNSSQCLQRIRIMDILRRKRNLCVLIAYNKCNGLYIHTAALACTPITKE